MSEQPPTVTTVGQGVARVRWGPEMMAAGWLAAVDVVRREVAAALVDHHRVEAWVDADDQEGQRVATWSGLRREGVMRGIGGDTVVFARLVDDVEVHEPGGFRALLNSFLPRKRAISQLLVRSASAVEPFSAVELVETRVLLCQLTYKQDWDLPGGVVEVGESPQLAVSREVQEELGLTIAAGRLLLTDWLPPWGGWDDALCLVFDGGAQDPAITDDLVLQAREIRAAEFCTLDEVEIRCADFTARRIRAALANSATDRETGPDSGTAYTESGR